MPSFHFEVTYLSCVYMKQADKSSEHVACSTLLVTCKRLPAWNKKQVRLEASSNSKQVDVYTSEQLGAGNVSTCLASCKRTFTVERVVRLLSSSLLLADGYHVTLWLLQVVIFPFNAQSNNNLLWFICCDLAVIHSHCTQSPTQLATHLLARESCSALWLTHFPLLRPHTNVAGFVLRGVPVFVYYNVVPAWREDISWTEGNSINSSGQDWVEENAEIDGHCNVLLTKYVS
jgi:hypothetical protein